MKNALWRTVKDFLHCGGYNSFEIDTNRALERRRVHFRTGGSIDYRSCGLMNVSGFEMEENGDDLVVRFVGRPENEAGALRGYARVLLNCGLHVETEEDPSREGWQILQVSRNA